MAWEQEYRERCAVYAERFGASERTVKRWVANGREWKDACPLDDATALAAWWQKHMKQRVPDEILRAQPADALMELPVVVPKAAAPPVVEVPPAEEVEVEVSEDELGLERTLERLARMEARLHREAHKPGHTKAWLDTISRMGNVAEKLRVQQERLGELLPKSLVEQVIHGFHGPIEREVRLLYGMMCQTLGLPHSPDREEAWSRACDKLFARLGEEVLK